MFLQFKVSSVCVGLAWCSVRVTGLGRAGKQAANMLFCFMALDLPFSRIGTSNVISN